MTLALLLTAVTGAWAVEPTVYNSTVAVSDLNEGDILIEGAQVTLTSDHSYYLNFLQNRFFLNNATTPSISGFVHNTTTVTVGVNGLVTGLSYDATARPATESGEEGNAWEVTAVEDKNVKIVGITYTAPAGPKVDWNASTKTGTFAMPGSDVVLTPIYAEAAAFATTGTEPEVKTLLPEAAEGVIAGTDASLIAEGTGIVAFAGTSTEVTQGTLMYAIGTSATEAPALTAFSATVPTAKDIADDGADVYVWYYIQGADTPDGQQATEENTFNDSEICTEPLKVTVLTNKFDITFKAANANTIEAGKATVTVGGTAATVTDGKLQGVKMGSEVKVKANTGYKFRKVEVKKGAPDVKITSFSLQGPSSLDASDYATISIVNIVPSNATNQTFTWSTSGDISIFEVSNETKTCVVRSGENAGNASVTATANDGSGVSYTLNITITGDD